MYVSMGNVIQTIKTLVIFKSMHDALDTMDCIVHMSNSVVILVILFFGVYFVLSYNASVSLHVIVVIVISYTIYGTENGIIVPLSLNSHSVAQSVGP